MLALGLGLTAALIWAVHDLLARKLSQGAALLPIVLVVLGAGTLALIGPVMVLGDWSALSGAALRLALAAGLAFALAIGTLYRAFSIAPARIVSPIIGAYPMLSLAIADGKLFSAWMLMFTRRRVEVSGGGAYCCCVRHTAHHGRMMQGSKEGDEGRYVCSEYDE